MFDEFHRMVKGDLDAENEQNHLGRLKTFAGVREFPARVKCANLSWPHAARSDLKAEANRAPPKTSTDRIGRIIK
jgi:nitrogen fixation NifU-like protein